MADTQRSLSDLLALIPTGTPGGITAQELRDILVSVINTRRMGVEITSTTTLDEDADVVKCGTGTYTVNLPAVADSTGMVITFIKLISAGTITIEPNASEQINGANNVTMTTQYTKMTIWCDGSTWWIIG